MKRLTVISVVAITMALLQTSCKSSSGSDSTPDPKMTLSTERLDFGSEGGKMSFEIDSNVDWSISENVEWFDVYPRSGKANKITSIEVTAQANHLYQSRSATLGVYAAQLTKNLTVVQNAPTAPAPDPTGMDDDAVAMAAKMGLGWNIGNTLEPPDGEGTWNNPRVTQQLIETVAAAGFTTVRIPCAWDSHIKDRTTYEIDPAWLDRVAEVVGWCLDEGLYVMLNTHWDGGWLEENPYYDKQQEVNTQLAALWNQIAVKMRDFDQRLLFAGTNEVHHGYDAPKAENIAVQESFNQTFVDAVRATGGKNAYRNLVVQAYNTNIDYAIQYFSLPKDSATRRLLLEVHYYDPWEFTIMGNDDPGLKLVWGNRPEAPVPGEDPRKPTWGDETYADGQFAKMKTNFVDKGIPVIVGEYGGTFRTGLGDNQADHDASNVYYMGYMTRAMEAAGLVPVYWDNGAPSDGSGLFDRRTYEIVHTDVLNAIIGK